jgi:hypothetical protein
MLVSGVDGINGEYVLGSGELSMHSQNESIAVLIQIYKIQEHTMSTRYRTQTFMNVTFISSRSV